MEKEQGSLFREIIKVGDIEFYELAVKHISNALKLISGGVPDNSKKNFGFRNKEEFYDFVHAKLFIKLISPNAEVDLQSGKKITGYDFHNYLTPPVDTYHLTDYERNKGKQEFLDKLQKGEVLDCIVVSESEERYHLIVLQKYGDFDKVDAFLIPARLIKSLSSGLSLSFLKTSTLVRVCFLGFIDELEGKSLLTTLIPKKLHPDMQHVLLGHLERKTHLEPMLPGSLYDLKYKSLSESLKMQSSWRNVSLLRDNLQSLGLEKNKVYSLKPDLNMKMLSNAEPGAEEIDKLVSPDGEFNRRNYLELLKIINKTTDPTVCQKAREKITLYLTKAAKKMIEKNNYNRAVEYFKIIQKILCCNRNAVTNLEHIIQEIGGLDCGT